MEVSICKEEILLWECFPLFLEDIQAKAIIWFK